MKALKPDQRRAKLISDSGEEPELNGKNIIFNEPILVRLAAQ